MAFCRHCDVMSEPHTYVCNCGHHHSDHIFAGGCLIDDCPCSGYDQRRQCKPGEKFMPKEERECQEPLNTLAQSVG